MSWLDDAVGHALFSEVARQDFRRETRLILVEVHGGQLEAHRRAALERAQDVEQRVGVLAAREADHHPVALGDHAEVGDGLANRPPQLRRETLQGAGRLRGGRCHWLGILGARGHGRPDLQAAATLAMLSRYFAST